MEKSMDTLRQTQAKCSELEKTNKKLYSQTHIDRKEIIKLREVSRRNDNNHTRYETWFGTCMGPLFFIGSTGFRKVNSLHS